MPPEQMSVRLELFVQDMDQAIAFYTHILGFKVLRREEDYAGLRNGGQREQVQLTVFGHDGEQWQTLKKAPDFYS